MHFMLRYRHKFSPVDWSVAHNKFNDQAEKEIRLAANTTASLPLA
jgi:hypothetical protein